MSTEVLAAPTVEEKIDVLASEIEQLKAELARRGEAAPGVGERTAIGGYGELHYNHLDSKEELDFHRFVLFFGHRFSDRIRFFSELELEHALVEDTDDGSGPGEVELEQAFIDFDLTENHVARAGLFLLPIGILNETHEPTTFYGVERNPVETNIIPTTWWEGGAGLYGRLRPTLGYDLAFTSGLNVPTTGGSAYSIRSGRQKGAKAVANDGAVTARLRWTAMPGVAFAVAGHYQQDVTQGQGAPGTEAEAVLGEADLVLARGPFGLRALYARWDLQGDAPAAIGRDEQVGWYVEPSYKITPRLGVFARYNEWDNQAGDAADSKRQQVDAGLNYWPHENVVLKLDVQNQSGVVDDDGFNLGVGYMF